MKHFYLYKITNILNNKIYIGMTSRPEVRFKEHSYPYSTCTKLRNSIQKYGIENFQYTLLCVGSEEYILDLEEKAIILYDTLVNGYNLVLGNPKTGAILLTQEVKDKISSGLNKYHSENVAWNKGIVIGPRKQFDPCYVTGFWFPHPQVAVEILNINIKTYYSWKNNGTLGEVRHISKDAVTSLPVYVSGFWFDNYYRASDALCQEVFTLRKRVRDGNIEQKNNVTFKLGEDNHMFGRTGFDHHRSKAVKIDGIIYGSISEAARETAYTKKMIYTRLKNNTPEFSWVI